MARELSTGVPRRARRYLPPRAPYRLFVPALAAGGCVAAAAFLLLLAPAGLGLRLLASPGKLATGHAAFEEHCGQCHLRRLAVGDTPERRCLRCHGSSGPSGYSHAAHVTLAQRRVPLTGWSEPGCASCHQEHRGREASAAAVESTQCAACHFRSFARHPEFAVAAGHEARPSGLQFSHVRHLQADVLERFRDEGMSPLRPAGEMSCILCHEPDRASDDLQPVAFDRHCAACHARELSAGTEPVAVAALALLDDGPGIAVEEGEARKRVALHRDPFVLANRDALLPLADAAGHQRARAELIRRRATLVRWMAPALPVAELPEQALRERAVALEQEARDVTRRLLARERGGDATPAAAAELPALEPAAAEHGRLAAQVQALVERVRAGPQRRPEPISPQAFQEARARLRALLAEVRRAAPERAALVESLTSRLEEISPGEESAEALARRRMRVHAEQESVRDELELVETGARPPLAPPQALLRERERPLREALARLDARLASLTADAPPGVSEEAAREAVRALWSPCKRCHGAGALVVVQARSRVLLGARFVHAPHLRLPDDEVPGQRCTGCHAGIATAARAEERHVPGVAKCALCHDGARARDACLACHRYHPLGW